jgi:hypothetical protein
MVPKPIGFALRWVYAASKLAREQSVCFLPGNSSPNLFPMMLSLATPNPSPRRTLHKRNQAWSCDGTYQFFRPGCNHPGNGEGGFGHQPTHSQAAGRGASCECKDSMLLQSMQSRLQTLTSIGWMIFGFLVMKEANPTMPLWLRLSTGWALALLLTGLPPICERLLEHLWQAVSCHTRMAPNGNAQRCAAKGSELEPRRVRRTRCCKS